MRYLITTCFLIIISSLVACGGSSSGGGGGGGSVPDCGELSLAAVTNFEASDGTYTSKVALSWDKGFLWEVADNDGAAGAYASSIVETDGTFHVAYKTLTGVGGKLMHAWKTATGCWNTETVDESIDNIGAYTDMDIDSNGTLHISYYDETNGSIRHAYGTSGSWSYESAATGVSTSLSSTGIAVSTAGIVHITFKGNSGLIHAYKNSSSSAWQTETVVASMGQAAKIDTAGTTVYIAYHTSSAGGVDVISKEEGGSTWTAETIDSNQVGLFLDFHIQGTTWETYFMISYFDSENDRLKMAWKSSVGTWSVEVVDDDGTVGWYTSIDSSGYPAPIEMHISYYDLTNGALKHAWKETTASSWNTEMLDSTGSTGQWTAIAYDDTNVLVHIAYYDQSTTALKHAFDNNGVSYEVGRRDTIGSGAWTTLTTTTDTSYDDTSVTAEQVYEYQVVPSANSYSGDAATDTGYAAGSETVDDTTSDVGKWNSIAVSSDGTVHISYYDDDNNYLKHAWKTATSTTWSTETVDDTGNTGRWGTSIGIDSDGTLHISYHDASAGVMDLRHAYGVAAGAGWTWTTEDVETDSQVGLYSHLTIDDDDTIHVSYQLASTEDDLKYARGISNGQGGWTWTTQVVDTTGTVGMWTGISHVVGSNPDLHISYYDEGDENLKHALGEWNTQTASYDWTTEVVDGASELVGQYTSIYIDGDGRVHISYYDESNDTLKHAWLENGGTTWNLEVADTASTGGFAGKFTSIVTTDDGNVYISEYTDNSGFYLKLATGIWNTSTTVYDWTSANADDTANVGTYTSMAVGPDGFLNISYYTGDSTLKYTNVSP